MNALTPKQIVDRLIEDAATATTILPPDVVVGGGREDESERERLLTTWRLHPDALVDLVSPEIAGGSNDGAGVVQMTDTDGNDVDEFRFTSADEADGAVDYALRRLNPES